MALFRILKYLWALPTTSVGLLAAGASLITGGRLRLVRGVLEVHGGLAAVFLRFAPFVRGGASASTLGHAAVTSTDTAGFGYGAAAVEPAGITQP